MADDRPAMPKVLSGEAEAEWRRVVPVLAKQGLLSKVDRGALIRYCTAWADWVAIDEDLRRTGRLVRGRRDPLIRNPLWLLRKDVEPILSDLGRQLGLTPWSREGMKREEVAKGPIETDGDSDKITELRSRRQQRAAYLDEASS